ncbi:MAG: hypothetical protein AMJ56_08560 [Anaerolineae bacterium SG8_19]|nr:MAG: hypothetical protein AMJ56_08560 [Anaerolineae bacterium SG8_19]
MKHFLIPATLIILFILSVAPSYAQANGVIPATVDRRQLSTDETLMLAVTLNANVSNPPSPTLPSLDGFNIVGSGSSSQISIVNGAISSQLTYNYRLQPYATGDLVIEPISVTLNGQTFSTEPITVQVVQGTGTLAMEPPANPSAPTSDQFRGQELFVEAEVDNPMPYLGEQVTYTFRFYEAFGSFGQPQYEAPTFTGFWTENQTDQSQYQVQAGGRFYNVTELHTVLFPSMAGSITIEPAQLAVPGGFFSSGGTLQTQPVRLDIKPLPANAPDSFTGAVGQFALHGTVDATQGKVNEPITWRLTISGQGNLNAIPDPVWPDMPEWRSFESQATTNTQFQNGRVVGERVYERLLVPQADGQFTIPALEFSYFDPVGGEYRTITTEPIPVLIAPGDAVEAQPPAPLPGGQKETVEQVATDIRHLKPVPSALSSGDHHVTESPLYWLAWSMPLLGIVGNFAWQRRQRYWQNNAGLARSSQARKKAKQALARVEKQKGDTYSTAGQVLTTYLADKLNQPVAGLTHQALAALLGEKGLQPELIERVNACLTDAELGRFSPEANDPAHAANLLREIDVVIGDLEKSL